MIKKVVKHSICELRQTGTAWVKVTKEEIWESSRDWAKRMRNKKIWVGEWVQHALEGALLALSSSPCWEERQVRERLGVTTGLCQDLTCQRCPPPRPLLGRGLRSSDAAFALSLLTYQPGGEVRGTVLGSSAMCLTSSSTSQTRSEDTSQRPVARGWAGLGLAAAKTHPKSSSCYCIAMIITILFPILSASHCLEEVVSRKEISVSTHMTESLKRSEKCRQESIP